MTLRYALVACALLLACSAAHAQRSSYEMFRDTNRMINNRINNDMALSNSCDEWRRTGQTVPKECGDTTQSAPPALSASEQAALQFTPHAGDNSVRNFADSQVQDASERAQLVVAINAVKRDVLEREYGPKGWKDNVAGAYAFLICSLHLAWTGNEPSMDQKDALFASLGAKLGPSLVGVPDKDKTELYNTLIAGATLPLLLHLDGKDKNDQAEIDQARELAAHYSRTMLKMEPQELAGLLR